MLLRNKKPKMATYIKSLEDAGKTVYYPARDTNQEDSLTGGYRICLDNTTAIRNAKEVHIFFDPKSTGSNFDFGVAFALKKEIVIVNPGDLVLTEGKSFDNMLNFWSKLKK